MRVLGVSLTTSAPPELLIDENLLFGTPLVLDAARMTENCFSLSFIAAPSCQAGPRARELKRVSGASRTGGGRCPAQARPQTGPENNGSQSVSTFS
jgi:hypothetical protein